MALTKIKETGLFELSQNGYSCNLNINYKNSNMALTEDESSTFSMGAEFYINVNNRLKSIATIKELQALKDDITNAAATILEVLDYGATEIKQNG